jgi:rod shape-determining protein MreD
MRTATIVLVAYAMCVVVASVWRMLGPLSDAVPHIGALTAAYLGHTSRPLRWPSTAGAVALGYLIDIISGTPPGLTAVVLGLTTTIARTTQQRILVRGSAMTIGFSAFIAIVAALLSLLVRWMHGMALASFSTELRQVALIAIATAVAGPAVWHLFRRIDAAYARTHRDRDAALEGIT